MTYRNKIQNRNRYKRKKDKERIEKKRNEGSVPNTPRRERMNNE